MPTFRRKSPSAQDQFAAEIIDLVRETHGLQASRRDDFALQIEQPGGLSVTMNLDNIYAETQALDGPERDMRLRTAVLAALPVPHPASWREAAPLLLPAVRAPSWVAAIGGDTPDPHLAGRPLAPFVRVLCAIDSAHSIAFATGDDLAAWGVSDEQALRAASSNLARRPCLAERRGPVTVVTGPDGYASSWLAAPGALAAVAADIGDSVIAVAPSRDELLLLDTGHPDAARILEATVERYRNAVRQLSPVPYLVAAAGIEPWEPPADHPARPVVARTASYLAAVEYGRQKTMLDDLDEDVYVGSYTLMQRSDGSLWSWTPWVRQVTDGLLPRADRVSFADNDSPATAFFVPWDEAVALAGGALADDPRYDPPRWRHHGWPDDDTVARLRERSVPPR